MPKLHRVAQYSDAWDALRVGIPTASSFDKIITPSGAPSKSWKGYAHGLIAERILRRRLESFMSPWMERGQMLESDAVKQYELQRDIETTEIGFVTDEDHTIGCSPDRLIGDDGLLEIKVPKPETQIGYLLGEPLDKDYYPQVQGQLFVTERKWVDIMSYHPEMPPVIIRMQRDEEYITTLCSLLKNFNRYVEDKILHMATLTHLVPRRDMIAELLDDSPQTQETAA
jgi:hypothetical protein